MSVELELLRQSLAEPARDAKLNLEAVLRPDGPLTAAQRWGVAVAAAATARNPRLVAAVTARAAEEAGAAVVEDGLAAASLMAMNNVYYRFRHMFEKPAYRDKPARLRMNRLVKPAGNKVDFELFSLAASAINGCETCVRAHEEAVLAGGLTEDHVHDAVRIAAVINAAALSVELT
ncbi:MAG TPA: carboxymuconolactone decarboxylase family protein [Kofleriaceae bacterium]|nr:carboxymuconolactone decarboxylase family protein [Kofleriaceae bacterium]